MENNLFPDVLTTTINLEKEPYLIHLNDVLKILLRVLMKNIDIFAKLQYYQLEELFTGSNKLMLTNDAGDIYQYLRMKFLTGRDEKYKSILNDNEFNLICMVFTEQIKDFPSIYSFANIHTNAFDKVWDICKYLIIPIRLNPATIPRNERERILRLWLSIIFTLPINKSYNNRYLSYGSSVEQLRYLYDVLKPTEIKDGNPIFDASKIKIISETKNELIDQIVSPTTLKSQVAVIFRTYLFISLRVCIEVIRKSCPNLKECKMVNADYDGEWLHPFDEFVSGQIKKICDSGSILMPNQSRF